MPTVKMFAFWDVPKLEAAIQRLEDQIASGAQNVSSPDAGAASFATLGQSRRILSQLYARWEEKTGQKVREEGLFTVINISVRKSF